MKRKLETDSMTGIEKKTAKMVEENVREINTLLNIPKGVRTGRVYVERAYLFAERLEREKAKETGSQKPIYPVTLRVYRKRAKNSHEGAFSWEANIFLLHTYTQGMVAGLRLAK